MGEIIMAIVRNMRAVLDCCGSRFSKVIDYWHREPVIGEGYTLNLFPGQGWGVHVVNMIPASDHDKVKTFFFTSEDSDLFECLCNCLTPEKGWVEGEGERVR